MPATIASNEKVLATANPTQADGSPATAVTYTWNTESGGTEVTLATPEGASTEVAGNPTLAAEATATLTVTVINADGSTVSSSDTVTVTVAAPPPPPSGNATAVSISFGAPEPQ
jgi:hypothetical protein